MKFSPCAPPDDGFAISVTHGNRSERSPPESRRWRYGGGNPRRGWVRRRHGLPGAHHFQPDVMVFNDGGAAIDPVPAIDINVVRLAQRSAPARKMGIDPHQQFVTDIAKDRQPAVIPRHLVVPVAMQQQIAAIIGRTMDMFEPHLDLAEPHAVLLAQGFAMIAGNDHEALAVAGPAQGLSCGTLGFAPILRNRRYGMIAAS